MAETNTINTTSYTSNQKNVEGSNVQEAISKPGSRRADSSDVQNNKKNSEENVLSSDYEEPRTSTGLKRKASTSSLSEAKRKRSTEDQVLEEGSLDPEDPKNLMFHVDALKAECMWKDSQIEKLKIELAEKVEEIKRLLATNNRYKSGLACIICTGYLANPCTISCGHSFCYSCLREWLKTNRENKCPSCRAEITTQPVLSYVLKDQVEALIEQLSPEEKKGVLETLEREDMMYKQISDHWAGIFDQSIRPLVDEEDGVLRCPTCGWEVEGSTCGRCNQCIDVDNRDDDSVDDNSEIDNWDNEFDAYDSNDSFIDDGSDTVAKDNDTDDYEDLVTGEHENEDVLPLSRLSNAIVINDSSSELSEEQSECDNTEKNDVIVISSDEDGEEKSSHSFNSHGSQPSSPLSISPYVTNPSSCEPDEEPFRARLNARRMSVSLEQDESQEHAKNFSASGSEFEFAERNLDVRISSDSDGSRHAYADEHK